LEFLLSLKDTLTPEIVTALLTAFTAITTVLILIRQRTQQKLYRTQLEKLEEEKVRADVRASLRELVAGGDKWCFVLENRGKAAAREVRFVAEPVTGTRSPLADSEIRDKLPIGKLRAGEQVELAAHITPATGSTFEYRLQWIDEDELERSRPGKLAV